MYKSFATLVKFIPKYFTLLNAIVNKIVFITSSSDYPRLVYRNTTDFQVLILYHETNSLVIIIFMECLGFSIYSVMSSANCDSFISSFPIWIPFSSFSCLTAVARLPNTILTKGGESGYSGLLILEEMLSAFHR